MTAGEQVSLKEHMDSRLDTIAADVRGVHHRLDEVQAENRRDHDHVREMIGDAPARLVGVETSVDLLGSGQAKLNERVDHLEDRENRLAGSITAMKVIGGIALTFAAGGVGALVTHFLG